VPAGLLHLLGALPSYYLHYYYCLDENLAEQAAPGWRSRAEVVAELEAELLVEYRDPSVVTKPKKLSYRGGAFYSEAAVALLASLVTDARDRQVVNVRNHGTLPFLADEAVIEVSAIVGSDGATPVQVAPVDPLMSGLIAHVSAYEELALDAAIRGGRDRVAKALLAHPLVGQFDLAGQLADRLLAENAAFLSWAR
jgi:6-phospho-beta-glucosidase